MHSKVQRNGTLPLATNFLEPPQREVPGTILPRARVNGGEKEG